jgi:DNA-binding Lrp family transcriptional regulator
LSLIDVLALAGRRNREVPLAFVMINAEIGKESEVLNQLKKIEHVKEVYPVYGVYDIVARVEAETMDELNRVVSSEVRRLAGVRSTLTMVAM